MVYCSVCNNIYPPGTRYCTRCKTHLSFIPSDSKDENQMKCPSCGETTPLDSGKCQFCDRPLSAETLDLTQSTALNEETPSEPPIAKPKKKKKKSSHATNSKAAQSDAIETLQCPKCGNAVLADFENCPSCGTKIQPASSSNIITPPVALTKNNEKPNVIAETLPVSNPEAEPKPIEPEPEIVWETMECPSCHKTTRIDTGHCRHCNSPLKADPVEKEIPVKTPDIPEAASPQKPVELLSKEPSEKIPDIPKTPVPIIANTQKINIEKPVEAPPQKKNTNPKPPTSALSSITIMGIAGIVILCVIFLTIYYWKYSKNSSETVQPIVQNQPIMTPTATIPVVPSDSDAILQVLNNVRESTLSQDTALYLSAFSYGVQDLQQKVVALESFWKTYKIQDVKYDISPDHPLTIKNGQADIVIIWTMNLQQLSDNKITSSKLANFVKLEKQKGNWKIVEVSVR